VDLIGRARLPAMYGIRAFVDEGGLIAYAYDLIELNRRAAHDVESILHGTKPGEIPVFKAPGLNSRSISKLQKRSD
jgi:putative ABC transport system substrate-binding protein